MPFCLQAGSLPTWLIRLRIVELTFDHSAPYFSNMRRRNSRKDSDLTGVVDARYTGGARMLLMLELGQGRWRFKIPVLVSDLDLQCALWLKLRLAPMCPWIGTISLAFVGPPAVKVQLSPYNRVRLMRIPVLQVSVVVASSVCVLTSSLRFPISMSFELSYLRSCASEPTSLCMRLYIKSCELCVTHRFVRLLKCFEPCVADSACIV